MVTIRQIGPDDWQAFRDVRIAALADAPGAFGATLADTLARTDEEWRTMVRNRTASSHSAIWLTECDDGTTAGVVAVDRSDGTGEAELISMWVAPAHRGTGIARSLIEVVLARAGTSGAATVGLWVRRSNLAAQRLYESCGFSLVEEHPVRPDDPCADEIRMRHIV